MNILTDRTGTITKPPCPVQLLVVRRIGPYLQLGLSISVAPEASTFARHYWGLN
jgi:hypothetical protein